MDICHKTFKTNQNFLSGKAARNRVAAGKRPVGQLSHAIVIRVVLLCFVCFVNITAISAQEPVRIAFWNLESFFDPFVDSTLTYNDFTENGQQHWTKSRFYRKRNNLYKAILALSENRPLGIMGVCEVENEYVLVSLFAQTPLKNHNYRWVHYEGPDRRGIEPAIVYSLDHFMLVESAAIPYVNSAAPESRSRDILYAKFVSVAEATDTLHVFVNHWPSKYSGELETENSRACAASLLRAEVDSILAAAPDGYQPKVIIMGDMNDTPDAASVHDVLRTRSFDDREEGSLTNLMGKSEGLGFEGTLKYHSDWQILDQIIVTDGLLKAGEGLHCQEGSARIFHPDFLLEDDATWHGKKPYRTYVGPRYIGGFSDHLPVYMDLVRY